MIKKTRLTSQIINANKSFSYSEHPLKMSDFNSELGIADHATDPELYAWGIRVPIPAKYRADRSRND